MHPVKWGILALSAIALTAILISENERSKTRHVQKGVVLEVGSCYSFRLSYRHFCPVRVDVNGKVYFWTVEGSVMRGQIAYRECWYEGDEAWCHTKATLHPDPKFLAGGEK